MWVIQGLTVFGPELVLEYRVGAELKGEAIIEIVRSGAGIYEVKNENGQELVRVENCAVVVEYVNVEEG